MYQFTKVLFYVSLIFSYIYCHDYSVTPVTTSSGLYYEKVGEVLLTNNNWQFVTSVDYKGYLLFYEYLLQQADEIQSFCETFNSSLCMQRYRAIQTGLNSIEERDEQMANFLGITKKPTRVKRFWSAVGRFFKKIGGAVVNTIFGGGSREVDLSPYNQAIGNLQNGQRELENQVQLQRTLFMIDSERKNFQIDWLTKTQGEIQNKISTLEGSFLMDKEKKEKEINELRKMLDETEEKIKAHDEHLKKLDGQVDKIENELLLVNSNIKEIKDKISNNEKRIGLLEVATNLQVIAANFDYLMDQFKDEQKTLFEVIKNAARGNLDPYILTPLNLVEMLEDIQPHLPEGTKFPYYPNIENARKLYNVIKPSVYLYDYKIIFILRIPLVYSKTLNLHKITSLPVSIEENKFAFILPQDPFMLIDNSFQDYMLMSLDNFREFCVELETSKYICKQVQEIYHSYASKDCEIILFKSPRQVPDSCNKRVMSLTKPIFLQLQQPRTWIYVIPELENIFIHCGRERKVEYVKGSGFIKVNENCLVRTTSELPSLVEFTKQVESNFSPPLNLTDYIDLKKFNGIETKELKNTQIILPFDLKKLEEISYGTVTERKMSLAPLYFTLLVVVVVAIIVFVYLVYKKKINLEKINNMIHTIRVGQPSTPMPSAQLQDNRDPESLKMKIKLSNPNDIKKVLVYGSPSETDPESEYLTVRFKVKKDGEPSVSQDNAINNKLYDCKKNVPPKVHKEERYLSELRKLKPKANDNDYIF